MANKAVAPAHVCKGNECLFGRPKAPYGVRQLCFENGNTYYYHHAWGIEYEKDAIALADRINNSNEYKYYCDSPKLVQ